MKVLRVILLTIGAALLVLLAADVEGQAKKAAVDVGADVLWLSYYAIDGVSNGEKKASRSPADIANEAVKRSCVKLAKVGQFVEWKVLKPANAIVLRCCVPDEAEGGGGSYSLSLAINGTFRQKLSVSSIYSWLYGKEPNPQSNSPSAGPVVHAFYDESRALIEGAPLKAGDVVRVHIDKGDTAPWCVVDLIDLESVEPPAKMPAGFLSILDFGAIPNDGKDDSAAMKACVDKAKADGKNVWIPAGTFHQSEPLNVNHVKVRGAGPWHTRLTAVGIPTKTDFSGNMGIRLAGMGCEVSDLSIDGVVTSRAKPFQHGILTSSNAPDGFRIENVWIEHTNTGCWLGPCSNGVISHCRIRGTYADGLNIHQNSHDVLIEHCHSRGTGDDGLAVFAQTDQKGTEGNCRKITLRRNTIEGVWWGNGLAIYGGADILAEQNLIVGVNRGTGLFMSTGFRSWEGEGVRVVGNLLIACGGSAQNQSWAGMQIYVPGRDLKHLVIQGNTIRAATSDAFKIQGNNAAPGVVEATFADNLLEMPAGHGIHILNTARGELTIKDNLSTGTTKGKSPLFNEAAAGQFTLHQVAAP